MTENNPMPEGLPESEATLKNPPSETPVTTAVCPTCGLAVAATTRFCPNDSTPINNPELTRAVPGYQFIKLLGSGGMGDVYEAEHLVLRKRVAIKTLKSHLIETSAFMRFQTEARAASSLKHPNIVGVYDCGLSETGEPFMIMDLVKGETLAQLIKRRGALSIDDSINLLSQICAGVICAHEKGILHRDLKPSNVMLEQVEDTKVARILDFGIAKLLDTDDLVSHMTRTGELIGTPSYMSPEQVNGAKLDQRSDIYSVGCIFYEMLTGVPPILGKSAMETMHRHLTETPLPLSQAGLRRFPGTLETIVARALAKDPADRYPTLKEMLSALENFKHGKEEVVIRNQTPSLLDKKMAKIGIVALPIIIIAVIIVSSMMTQSSRNAKPEQVSPTPSPAISVISKGTTHTAQPPDTTSDAIFMSFLHRNCSRNEDIDIGKSGEGEEFTDITDAALEPLKDFYQLRYLRLGDCQKLTAKCLEYVVDLPRLTLLDLKDTRLGDEALPLIERMHLKNLGLARTEITNQGLLSLKNDLPWVDLNLKGTHVSDEGFKNIGRLKQLRSICLDNCRSLGDEGVAELSKLNLKGLRLSGTAITDKCVKSLLKMNELNSLTLTRTNLDDAALMQLSKLKKLAYIDVSECPRISEAAISKFRKLAPKCDVITGKHRT